MKNIKRIVSILVTSVMLGTVFAGAAYAYDYIPGDVDKDNTVTLTDVKLTLKLALGIDELDDETKLVADVNKDEVVNLKDAFLVLKKALGIISDFQEDSEPDNGNSNTDGENSDINSEKHTHNFAWEFYGDTRIMKCSCGVTKGFYEKCYNGYWGYYDAEMATELFNLCNSERQSAQYVERDALGNVIYNGNVQAVSRDSSLDSLAASRAVEVLSSWSHEGKDVDSYYNSENLAKGYDTVFDTVCAWAASHSHAATMTYQYYACAGAAWFWYDQDGTGENLIGVAVMEYGGNAWDPDFEW